MQNTGVYNGAFGADKFGLKNLKRVHWNLRAPQLYQYSLAAGEAVLDVVGNATFLAQVRERGDLLRGRLEQFIGNYPDLFEQVRGLGLMLGVKMKVEPRAFVAHLRDNHQVLTVSAGDKTLRLVPPLVIDEAHIDEFMEKLSAAAASYVPEGQS